jgi:glycosyltransferase involved in cell wall biosynthesis
VIDVCVIIERIGPYHQARLNSAGERQVVSALELVKADKTYSWAPVEEHGRFGRVTLFKDASEAGNKPRLRRAVAATLARLAPRSVAVHGWADPAAHAALAWCLTTGTPAVLMSESQSCDAARNPWRENFKSLLLRGFSAALVGGRSHVDYLLQLGVDRRRIFTGYDAVDNAYFLQQASRVRAQEASWRRQLGLPRRYFLASSRFVEKKNLFGLLRAYHHYRRQTLQEPWPLVLLGDGPLKAGLLEESRRMGLRNSLLLPGFRQYPELPAWYGLASAFVHASKVEPWGLVVNEALASGLPVLVSKACGCAADLVQEGINGYTFDPADSDTLAERLKEMAEGDCDLQAMGRAAQETVQACGPEAFAAGLHQAVSLALREPAPASQGLLMRQFLPAVLRWG